MQGRRAGTIASAAVALLVAVGTVGAGTVAHAQTAPGGWCTPGAKLDVLLRGVWFPATAKSNDPGGCLIGYDGYNASWDERVGPDRAGPRGARRSFASGGASKAASAPAAAPARPAAAGRATAATASSAASRPGQATPAQRPASTPVAAAAGAAPEAGGAGGTGGARLGSYHCVFYISGQGLQTVPGFTLQAGDRYRHESGGTGRTRFDAGAGVLEFTGGPLDGQAGKVDGKGVHLFNESRSRTVIDCNTK
jgi:hypothetical protein